MTHDWWNSILKQHVRVIWTKSKRTAISFREIFPISLQIVSTYIPAWCWCNVASPDNFIFLPGDFVYLGSLGLLWRFPEGQNRKPISKKTPFERAFTFLWKNVNISCLSKDIRPLIHITVSFGYLCWWVYVTHWYYDVGISQLCDNEPSITLVLPFGATTEKSIKQFSSTVMKSARYKQSMNCKVSHQIWPDL